MPTIIENLGDFRLQSDDVTGQYSIVELDPITGEPADPGSTVAITALDGAAVTTATIPGWSMIQAEEDGNGGYTVLWQSSTDDYVTWSLTGSGQQQLFEADGDGVVDDAFAFVSNTDDVEVLFEADLDGDGDSTGADVVAPVIEAVEGNGDIALETSNGAYTLVLADASKIAITDQNGAAVTTATIPGWSMIQAEEDGNGGYTVLWQSGTDDYVTWSLTGSGQQQLFEADGDGVVDDAFAFVSNTDDVEVLFEADLDGDGDSTGADVVAPVIEAVEGNGDIALETSNGAYTLVLADASKIAITDQNGAAVTTATIPGWSMIQAEEDGNGGYTVLWQSGTDDYVTWSLTGSGQQQLFEADGDGVVDDAFAFVSNTDDVEVLFEADLDGDGDSTGADVVVPVAVEGNGDIALETSNGAYTLVLADASKIAITDQNGAAVTTATIPGWSMIQAEEDGNGGYTVLWQSGTDDYVTWSLTGSGQQQLFEADGDGVVDDAFAFVSNTDDVEVLFEADLDGDGDSTGADVVAPVIEAVEGNGDIALETSNGAYTLVLADASKIAITDQNGAAVTTATIPGWSMIQAEEDGNGGYTVLWQSGTDDYVTWSLTGSGQQQLFEADGDGVVDDAFAFVSNTDDVEVLFEADLDGDGDSTGADVVAPVIEAVEGNGDIALETSNGAYTLVLADASKIAITDQNGAAVTTATIPGWSMIQAEEDGNGGYTVLWQSGTDDYVTWSLTGSGQQQLFEADGDGVVDDAFAFVSNTDDVEVLFEADLDGDGDSTGADVVAPVIEAVEGNGDIALETSNGAYTLVLADASKIAITDQNGAAVTTATIPGWSMIQAEEDGNGGYTVLWQSGTDDYVTWSLTGSGQQQLFEADGDGVVDDTFAFVSNTDDVEVLFEADLDGDGDSTGADSTPIESNGDIALVTKEGTYTLVLADNSEVEITDVDGLVPPLDIFGFTMIQAEADGAGGYTVLWQAGSQYITWSLDSNGQQQLVDADGDGAVDEEFFVVNNVESVEQFFQADLDGDTFLFVEDDGVIALNTNPTSGQFVAVLADTTEVAFTYDGVVGVGAVTQDNTDANVLQVELDLNDDFIVLLETGGLYETQIIDASGVVDAASDATITDIDVFAAEDLFQTDLDGDGQIGLVA